MRLEILVSTIASMLLAFSTTASALEVDANVLGVFTDATFSTLVGDFAVDAGGDNATATLAAGQGILIGIDIANPSGQNIDAILTSIVTNNGQVTFLAGQAVIEVLVGGPVFAPTSLARRGQPTIKPGSPSFDSFPSEEWIQSTAFATQGGTTGTGPDVNAVQLFFQVNNASGNEFIDFNLTLTQGDAINSAVDGDITAQTILSGATVNVPEPGTALLMGLGLIGLAAAGRRER